MFHMVWIILLVAVVTLILLNFGAFRRKIQALKVQGALVGELEHLASATYKQARRVVILVVGSTILLGGIIMIFLPGPAILVIPLGLSILAIEFAWARLWLRRVKKTIRKIQEKLHLKKQAGPLKKTTPPKEAKF
jgi:uncharacterized protein (TIGR02611 family)